MKTLHYCVAVMSVAALLSRAACAAPLRIEAESPRLTKPDTAKIVADAEASGGRAVEISGKDKKIHQDLTKLAFPPQPKSGRYRLKVRMKVQGFHDLGKSWRIEVKSENKVVGYGAAHGYYFKNTPGYRDFDVAFDLPDPRMPLMVEMFWAYSTFYADPVRGTGVIASPDARVRLDSFELTRLGDLPSLRITKVWPDKIHYYRNDDGSVAVRVKNTTGELVAGQVRVELLHDLNDPVLLGLERVSLPAGQAREFVLPVRRGRDEAGEFGYEVRAAALVDGRATHAASEYFCVSDNPWLVSTWSAAVSTTDEDPPDWQDYGWAGPSCWRYHLHYRIDQTQEILDKAALDARKAYCTAWEFYSWSPGGCMDMAPKRDRWLCGDTGKILYSKRLIKMAVGALHKQGIPALTYNIPEAQDLAGPDLIQKHPEWFATSPDLGDFTRLGYDTAALEMQRDFYARLDRGEIDTQKRYWTEMSGGIFFMPNFARQDVVRYVIDQMVASVEMFGWDGVRWDCGQLHTGNLWGAYRPFLDFYGNPLNRSPDEMVAQTVANIRQFKDRLAEVKPNFCHGYNFGSVEWLYVYPRLTREMCRDGGWMLGEDSNTAGRLDNPLRKWENYYDITSRTGEHLTARGGVFNPFVATRFGAPDAADRLYETILRVAGHGHPNLYYRNTAFVAGDTTQFVVRFGRYVFDTAMRRVNDPGRFIKVSSRLWWQKSVQRKKTAQEDTWVVHLINPPAAEAIGENPLSRLPLPLKDIAVSIRVPEGRKNARAWALACESWTTGQEPRTTAVPLEVKRVSGNLTVRVPEVLFWKILVFEFK